MTRSYIDSGVLMAAYQVEHKGALAILDDPERELLSSNFVRLEVMPKAVFEHNAPEARFYEEFFDGVRHWPADDGAIVEAAYDLACRFGLSCPDALQMAAALALGADEFVTTEKVGKPLYRVTGIRFVTIDRTSA